MDEIKLSEIKTTKRVVIPIIEQRNNHFVLSFGWPREYTLDKAFLRRLKNGCIVQKKSFCVHFGSEYDPPQPEDIMPDQVEQFVNEIKNLKLDLPEKYY